MTGRLPRLELTALTAAALLMLTGCMTVHGEREVIPAVSKEEAPKVLKAFTDTYNKAWRTADPELISQAETGPLLAIGKADLTAERKVRPKGNPQAGALELKNARFTIPKQAGWPKFFVADADSNRGTDRWMLLFTRNDMDEPWRAAYLSLLSDDEVPDFALDGDGFAKPVQTGANSGLVVRPDQLSSSYADYLMTGKGSTFADGAATSALRAERKRHLRTPKYWTEYIDTPAHGADFAPAGLRTKDGGGVVFFASDHRQKQTVAKGYRPTPPERVEAVMTGKARKAVTLTRVFESSVHVPAKGAADRKVVFLNRLEGVTAAKGE
ncbi:hypothetical protein [Streptomyces zagrosensis]|uniref:DUF8094 domain-containing protein n=1 Tax=Streptomyces zagrosensis TaxID=1042984 RepID=A0A7W9Q5R7_9ACTN|nr:hypothetical protein [Streptomyces zagrosensis]MBB5933282.1 hypothetical protein [Streptomyces zagrosensis]